MNKAQKIGRVVSVAGSDPTAGAGLQADLKTITALKGYGMTVVTAVTVQNTKQVFQVHPLPPQLVADQLRVCLEDIGADCIKLGMLATAEIVASVATILHDYPEIPVVADPVLAGTGGGTLLDHQGHESFMTRLLPRITLITPNLPEAAILTGLTVTNPNEMRHAARRLLELGATNALITGGHLAGEELTDLLDTGTEPLSFHGSRLPGPGFHGTGCTLAAAIATGIAFGQPIPDAVAAGRQYVRKAMQQSLALGQGQRLLG